MTTNARDEKWSSWIDYSGEGQPVPNGVMVEVELFSGKSPETNPKPSEDWYWEHIRTGSDIIAYRYKIEEPTDDGWTEWKKHDGGDLEVPFNTPFEVKLKPGKQHLMESYSYSNEDIEFYRYQIKQPEMDSNLRWLAENVHEWGIETFYSDNGILQKYMPETKKGFTRAQWQAARQQLGLDQPEVTEEEEEAWREKDVLPDWWKGHKEARKQERYQDAKGEDWIDEFARTATVDEFRGAMKFTIGKYNRRAGKKDELIKEIEKMRDYCCRWLEYERGLR